MLTRIIVVILLLLLANTGHAQLQGTLETFRGVKWGVHINEVKGLKYVMEEDGQDVYMREEEIGGRHKIGTADVLAFTYHFYKQRFFKGVVIFKEEHNMNRLVDVLNRSYGRYQHLRARQYGWATLDPYHYPLFIYMDWDGVPVGKPGLVRFIYIKIFDEYLEDLAKKGAEELKRR